jgi:ubiquinone/menaquinone biosynthesis C-methylase UbiE
MRKLKIYWRLFRLFGNAMRGGRQLDLIFRYFVVNALDGIGFFEFLNQPRSFGEIMSNFRFEDSVYAKEILDILVSDKENLVSSTSEGYVRNISKQMPELDQIFGTTNQHFHQFGNLAEAMQSSILERLIRENIGVKEVFEGNQRKVVNTFNELLRGNLYSTVRELCFEYLLPDERRWLHGKQLLEVGCGNGLETAEIWLLLKGNIKITAIDTVPSMLELAEEQFESLLGKLQPGHPRLSKENHPSFEQANAISLPYPDDSFDAVFWSMMLHWTSDPARAIHEAVRVVKPGGLIFGSQVGKPHVNPYANVVIRSSRDSYGFFWREDLIRWMADCGIELDNLPPLNIFRARKTMTLNKLSLP